MSGEEFVEVNGKKYPVKNNKLVLEKIKIQKISQIKGLSNLSNLTILSLAHNEIREIKALSKLKNLKTLNLSHNRISEFQGLSRLSHLTSLNLANNEIIQIKGIQRLKHIQHIDLSNNKIQEIPYSELEKLSGIGTILLVGNPFLEPDQKIMEKAEKERKEAQKREAKRLLKEAESLYDSGLYKKGYEIAKKSHETYPYLASQTTMANCLVVQGKNEEALKLYNENLDYNPHSPSLWNLRALCLTALGELELALASYKNALRFDPNNFHSLYNKAKIYFRLNKISRATTVTKEILDLAPNHFDTLILLSEIFLKKGLLEDASNYLYKARLVNPLSDKVTNMKNRIERKEEKQKSIEKATVQKIQKNQVDLFLCYHREDYDSFKISELVEMLKTEQEVNKVYHYKIKTDEGAMDVWDGSFFEGIIKYMNEFIPKSDIMILFCSKNSITTKYTEKGWTSAIMQDIPIIPVYTSNTYIPPLLLSHKGTKFNPDTNIEENMSKIHKEILEKMGMK